MSYKLTALKQTSRQELLNDKFWEKTHISEFYSNHIEWKTFN